MLQPTASREIAGILTRFFGALAAAERQSVQLLMPDLRFTIIITYDDGISAGTRKAEAWAIIFLQ
jgi:hypothetical protein